MPWTSSEPNAPSHRKLPPWMPPSSVVIFSPTSRSMIGAYPQKRAGPTSSLAFAGSASSMTMPSAIERLPRNMAKRSIAIMLRASRYAVQPQHIERKPAPVTAFYLRSATNSRAGIHHLLSFHGEASDPEPVGRLTTHLRTFPYAGIGAVGKHELLRAEPVKRMIRLAVFLTAVAFLIAAVFFWSSGNRLCAGLDDMSFADCSDRPHSIALVLLVLSIACCLTTYRLRNASRRPDRIADIFD